jgi:hypothetical protein
MKRYFIAKNGSNISALDSYTTYGSIFDWVSFSIEEKDYDALMSFNQKINEISKDIAVFGIRNFGDIRKEIRILSDNIEDDLNYEDIPSLQNYKDNSSKISIPVTEKRYLAITDAMKLIAKLIIEDVFEKRFVSLDYNVSSLEKTAWSYQLNDDSFVELIATGKNLSVEELKNIIQKSKKKYDDQVKHLYLNMVNLKQQFYSCATIEELNVLFEDYMGLPMPEKQAVAEGRYIVVEGIDLPARKEVIPGFKF